MASLNARQDWIVRRALASEGPCLDVGAAGAGEGRPAILEALLARKVKVVGLDMNAAKLRALGLPRSAAGDARRLPFADSAFGSALLCEVVEHLFEPVPVFLELRRVLKSGGRLILTTPNPHQPFLWLRRWLLSSKPQGRGNVRAFLGDSDHEVFWEPLSLVNTLSACGFEAEALTTVQHPVPFLKRFLPPLERLNIPVYPFDRLGVYTCLTALRSQAPLHAKVNGKRP